MADERERGGDGVGGAGGLRLGPRVEDVDDVVGGEAEGGARREDDGGACRGRRRGSLAWAQGARDAWARKPRRPLRRAAYHLITFGFSRSKKVEMPGPSSPRARSLSPCA